MSYTIDIVEQSVLGKAAYGLDGTNVTFVSSEYVQQVFSGTSNSDYGSLSL